MPCSHTTHCDLYVQFAADPSIQVWKTHYCDSDFSKCARFSLAARGQAVPLNLLPNGKMIEVKQTDADRGLHALFNAIQKNRLPMIKSFLKTKTISGKMTTAEGITPVMYAAGLGRTEIMEFFLEQGCNPHHRDRKGRTALDLATRAGHEDCVGILKEYLLKVAPPDQATTTTTATETDNDTEKASNSLMGRMLGFLRGHKPGAA